MWGAIRFLLRFYDFLFSNFLANNVRYPKRNVPWPVALGMNANIKSQRKRESVYMLTRNSDNDAENEGKNISKKQKKIANSIDDVIEVWSSFRPLKQTFLMVMENCLSHPLQVATSSSFSHRRAFFWLFKIWKEAGCGLNWSRLTWQRRELRYKKQPGRIIRCI